MVASRPKKFTLGGQLSLELPFRTKAIDNLTDSIIAPILTMEGPDTTLLDHLDASFVDIHLAICEREDKWPIVSVTVEHHGSIIYYLCIDIPEDWYPTGRCRSDCRVSR